MSKNIMLNWGHQKRQRFTVIVSLVAAAAILFVVRTSQIAIAQFSAQAIINLTSCQTITNGGSYKLMNDVTSSGTCFSIRASNVTFDGNGKNITAAGQALEFADFGGGPFINDTAFNFTTADEVRIYGDGQNHITIHDITAGAINNYGGDDVTIANNIVGEGGISSNDGDNDWHPYRTVITGNTVTGGSTAVKILVELAGGKTHPCARLDADIENNTITDTRSDPPPEATAAVRIRCATNTTFKNNTVHSTATTIGLYMRDESDYGDYENNTFWTHDQETLRIASGNVDKTYPANNVFKHNIFRSDNVSTMYFQGIAGNNLFQNNLFWGTSNGLAYVSGAFANTWDHNTFYVTGSGALTTLGYRTGPPADSWTNNIFDYSGTSLFGYDGWGSGRYSGNNNVFFNRNGSVSFGGQGASLSAWRTNTSSDANSREGDPLFVDAANGDFHLQASSIARGNGTSGTDIGAYPYSLVGCTENWICNDWSTCSNFRQTRTCYDQSACGTTTNRPALTQTCNLPTLVVTISAPADSASVSGSVHITADSPVGVAMSKFQFIIDGSNVPGATAADWYDWDTSSAYNGSHTIAVTGTAEDGRVATSPTITVSVNNAVPGVDTSAPASVGDLR